MKVLELFGGIGACSKALERLCIDYEIADYVEIDKYAVKSFNAMHGTNFEPQDICTWNKDVDVDLIMHGSPCQDFSVAGKNAGGDEGSGTRSSLMYETIRIVNKLKPKYVIWENVKNVISKKHKHNFDNYLNKMEELGYTSYWQVLNAKEYGIPQNRERVFTISIRNDINKDFTFPPKQELKLKLRDMLEDNVDEKYYLSDKLIRCFMSNGTGTYPRRERFLQNINRKNQDIANSIITTEGNKPTCNFLKIKNATKKGYTEAHVGDSINLSYPNSKTRRGRVGKQISQTLQCNNGVGVVVKNINKNAKHQQDLVQHEDGICRTIPAGTHGSTPHLLKTIVNEKDEKIKIRKLTPKECWRLMGFDDEDFEKAEKVNSNTQLYKQAGNSIVVNVLEAIFKNLFID